MAGAPRLAILSSVVSSLGVHGRRSVALPSLGARQLGGRFGVPSRRPALLPGWRSEIPNRCANRFTAPWETPKWKASALAPSLAWHRTYSISPLVHIGSWPNVHDLSDGFPRLAARAKVAVIPSN